MKTKIKIEQHSLWEFLKDVQEVTLKGYVLDLETNENFPQSYGSYYSVTLVQNTEDKEVPVVASLEQALAVAVVEVQASESDFNPADWVEVKEEPVAPVKRTRKPKTEAPE
jgi:hypothetical protein